MAPGGAILSDPRCSLGRAARVLMEPGRVDPCTGMRIIGHCAASRILMVAGVEPPDPGPGGLSAAITEPRGGSSLRTVSTVLGPDGLWGEKLFATNALYGGAIIVYAAERDTGEPVLAHVEPGAPGLRMEAMRLAAYRCSGIASLRFEATPARVLARGKAARKAVLQGLAENRVLVAALAIGLGGQVLRLAASWAAERGVARHQAVAHRLARSHALLEAARALVEKTLETIEARGLEDWSLTSTAKYVAVEAAVEAAAAARRTLAGHAFTLEEPGRSLQELQLHIEALEPAEGTQDIQLEIIARSLLGALSGEKSGAERGQA